MKPDLGANEGSSGANASADPLRHNHQPANHPLPPLRTFEEAQALAQKENDPFYLAAFKIQLWLGNLFQRAAAEYAEKQKPKDRSLQNGEAWQTFLNTFRYTLASKCHWLMGCLLRFSRDADSPANYPRRGLVPLSIEHHYTGDYYGPKTKRVAEQSEQRDPLLHRTIVRWCDWVDAAIHIQTHRQWHDYPACFHPDRETRGLAKLCSVQPHLARLTPRAKAAWLYDFNLATERYPGSPKWDIMGKALSAGSDRLWLYPQVDSLVICLWPLVKKYNWTYRDLLNVVRSFAPRPNTYPCAQEQAFVTYCNQVLGLRKTGKGASTKDGWPKGYEIAKQFVSPPDNGH